MQERKWSFFSPPMWSGYKANINPHTFNVEITIMMAVIGMHKSQPHACLQPLIHHIDTYSFHAGLQLNTARLEGIL